jgi:hypothetical protein
MSRLSRRLATASFASLSLAASIVAGLSPAISAKSFEPYGARGDASFRDTCPAGEYLTGLRVRSGAWLDQMAIVCRSPSGNLGGPYYGPARGGNGGGRSEGGCPGGYVVRGMNFTMTAGNRQVINITVHCALATDRSKGRLLKIGSEATDNNPGPPPQQHCPDGEAATGMAGRYGKHVNAVGLICDKWSGDARP